MNKNALHGWTAGVLVTATVAIAGKLAVNKLVKEVKSHLSANSYTSPDGDHLVTVSYGTLKTAQGPAFIKLKATTESKEDTCELVIFVKKDAELFGGEWIGNDQFKLLIGNDERRQCCDVSFNEDQITACCYWQKD